MGVYIKGVSKEWLDRVLMVAGYRQYFEDDDFIEVPEPHGRLIEAPKIEWETEDNGEKEISLGALVELAHKIDNAPTVIEAGGEQ